MIKANRGFLLLLAMLLVTMWSVPAFTVSETTIANNFRVTWYNCTNTLTTHSCLVDMQNLLSSPVNGRNFNLSILLNQTNYDAASTDITIYEWKSVLTIVPKYDIILVQQNCTADNTTFSDCSYNQSIENGTQMLGLVAWKPTKALLTKQGTNYKSNYADINIPKFESKEKLDDMNQTETTNGTKRFKIIWKTPVVKNSLGTGSEGLIAFVDEFSGSIFHPFWNTSYTRCRTITILEINGVARTNKPVQLFNINLSGARSDMADITLVNNSCDITQAAEMRLSVAGALDGYNSPDLYNLTFLINLTANQEVNWSIYYRNNTEITAPTRDVIVWDNFTDSTLPKWLQKKMSGSTITVTTTGQLNISALGDNSFWFIDTKNYATAYARINFTKGFSITGESRHVIVGAGDSSFEYLGVYGLAALSNETTEAQSAYNGAVCYTGEGGGKWYGVNVVNSYGSSNIGHNCTTQGWVNITTNISAITGTIRINATVTPANGTKKSADWQLGTQPVRPRNAVAMSVHVRAIGDRAEMWFKNVCAVDRATEFCTEDSRPLTLTIGTVILPNIVPTLFGLTILPSPAYINNTLNVSVLVNDSNGDGATVNISWYRNAVNIQNNSVSGANDTNITAVSTFTFVHFDNISVRAIANDTEVGTAISTSNLTISDTAPIVRTISFNLSTAYVNDSLNASGVYNDIDADSGALTIQWFRNSVNTANLTRTAIANATNVTNIYSGTAFVAFDNISFKANATSNNQQSAAVSSANLTISDTAPIVRTVSLNLSTAYVNDSLNASFVYNDIDAHSGACTIQWFRNSINTDNLTRTALTNSTNMTDIYSGTAFVRYDNISFKANCTSNGLQSVAVSSSNLTISNTAPRVNSVLVNETYNNVNRSIRISTNVTDIDGTTDISQVNITIYRPDATINQSSRISAAGTDTWEFNYTINTTEAEGNWSIEINANDTSNALATRVNGSFIIDITRPRLFLNRSDNGLLLGNGVNLTLNFEDVNINGTAASNRIYFFNPDDTLNFQRNITANASHEFNSTATNQVWNYTINITITDLANNHNSTTLTLGFGKINTSIISRLFALNFSDVDSSLGETAPLQNNTFWNISLEVNVTITSDGELSSRTNRTQINLTRIVGNWTTLSLIVRNRTGGNIPFANNTDMVNFSTNSMSTANTDSFIVRLDAMNTLNYSIHKASEGFYYYMVSNNSNSFNEYITILLPSSEVFDASRTHPRYFVCTDITRANPPTCNSFTTGIDVTSTNNANNGVNGYTVNMKVKSTNSSVDSITYMANHTDSLIQIIMISGSYISGTGTSVGGGGGIPPFVAAAIEEIQKIVTCPIGYEFNLTGTELCELPTPIASAEFGLLTREVALGLNVFHFIIIIGTLGALSMQRSKIKNSLKKLR